MRILSCCRRSELGRSHGRFCSSIWGQALPHHDGFGAGAVLWFSHRATSRALRGDCRGCDGRFRSRPIPSAVTAEITLLSGCSLQRNRMLELNAAAPVMICWHGSARVILTNESPRILNHPPETPRDPSARTVSRLSALEHRRLSIVQPPHSRILFVFQSSRRPAAHSSP